MRTPQLILRSWTLSLLVTIMLVTAPGAYVQAQSCCDSGDEADQAAETACAHAPLRIPDSATGRMVHAFLDLTYTKSDDALQAFLEERLAPGARERTGDESLLKALRTLRGDLANGEVTGASKTGAYSAEVVVKSTATGSVATLSFDLESEPPHRIEQFSADQGPGDSASAASCGSPSVADDAPEIAGVKLPAVGASLDELRDRFNADTDKLRFVALLSPTCGGCLTGARAIQQSVLDSYPDLDIAVHVVWLPMLGADSEASAKKSSLMYVDSRVQQYWDVDQSSGWAYTNDLFSDMGERMKLAVANDEQLKRDVRPRGQGPMWDIYMVYEPGTTWGETTPEPASWIMQMIPGYTLVWKDDFANPPLRSELVDEIAVLMRDALGGDSVLQAGGN